jgi:predicted metal-dependent phosphoesterase TrpH
MRCDLHLHSRHSGPLECYSEPLAVYDIARCRGMDLVTLTDHDSITGGLEIAHLRDTFLSEEVSCVLPDGGRLHLGVYGLSEAQHEQIARRRADAEAVFAYLAEQRLSAALNHPFSALTGRREPSDLRRAFDGVPLVEARNGILSHEVNRYAHAAARAVRRGLVGGSDAHTLASVARAFTIVPNARNREEFLAGLRKGLSLPMGRSGGYARMTADVARIVAAACWYGARHAVTGWSSLGRFALLAALLPLAVPVLPVATALVFAHEQLFARRHARLFREGLGGPYPSRLRTAQAAQP